VFSSNRRTDWEREPQDSEVFAVDVATATLTQLTKRFGPDASGGGVTRRHAHRLPRL
jgi:hypothetical protein